MNNKNSNIEVTYDDFWTMLLSTIRYSMGRQTYMPSVCIDMCKAYGNYLAPQQQAQIVKEIKREVELYEGMKKTLGADCDHRTWKQGYLELEKLWQI